MKVKNRLIYVAGIDGSGKSTLVKLLSEDLISQGYQVRCLWLRMNYLFTKPILLLCRIVGLTNRPLVNGKKISVHEFHRSPFIASIVRLLHTFDTFLHYLVKIYFPLKFSSKVIICDRFIYDVFVDFAVEGKNPKIFDGWLFRISKRMLNQAQVFLVNVEKDEILKRRNDIVAFDKDFDLRYSMYEKIKDQSSVISIENNESLEKVYQRLRKEVLI